VRLIHRIAVSCGHSQLHTEGIHQLSHGFVTKPQSVLELQLSVLPEPDRDNRWLRVPGRLGRFTNGNPRQHGIRSELTSDVAGGQPLEVEKAPHDRDSSFREVASNGQALPLADERNARERPFRVKAERGGTGGGAKADVHVPNHVCVRAHHATVGWIRLDRSESKAILKEGLAEADSALVTKPSWRYPRLSYCTSDVDLFDL